MRLKYSLNLIILLSDRIWIICHITYSDIIISLCVYVHLTYAILHTCELQMIKNPSKTQGVAATPE